MISKFGIALLASATMTSAFSQVYPDKPIRITVRFSPSAGTELLSRDIARKLQESGGDYVLVENRLGGGATIGVAAAGCDRKTRYPRYHAATDDARRRAWVIIRHQIGTVRKQPMVYFSTGSL
jgi:tripartite-type tricarboxylate transporter receptor subunit TctC